MKLLTFLPNDWISHEKTEDLEIVRFKEFQVVFTVSSFMGNPACFIKGVKKNKRSNDVNIVFLTIPVKTLS